MFVFATRAPSNLASFDRCALSERCGAVQVLAVGIQCAGVTHDVDPAMALIADHLAAGSGACVCVRVCVRVVFV